MSDSEFIVDLYRAILHRSPSAEELEMWTGLLSRGMADRMIVRAFLDSDEAANHRRIALTFPPAHFHSPIVNPEEAAKYSNVGKRVPPEELWGIDLSDQRQMAFWERHKDVIAHTAFPVQPSPGFRYYSANGVFPLGDAVIYRAVISSEKPRRIIEIGSGYSSAVALDAIDEFGIDTEMTCIDPDPARLEGLLRPADSTRVQIIRNLVQEVPLATFCELDPHDILFIDSSHVAKTGSDVNFEFFNILPALKPGVLIHFHDIGYPFEPPPEWVYDLNFSWNEVYLLRAFLMHNADYQVEFWSPLFAGEHAEQWRTAYPPLADAAYGSLWLRKVGSAVTLPP